ncbi:MAG: hypothetical protein ACLFRT_11375 [Actinomycetota bacterium]
MAAVMVKRRVDSTARRTPPRFVVRGAVPLLVAAVVGIVSAPATATEDDSNEERQWRGVAVDVGRIDVDEPLQPEETYVLPTIDVRNPGNLASGYRMAVQAIESDRERPPADWFSFDPATFHLEPEERINVEMRISVPRGSEPGDYEALVAAQLVSDTEGASVGGAAASRLTFAVAPGPVLSEIPSAIFGIVLAVVIVLLVARLARRYRFHIERRPTA